SSQASKCLPLKSSFDWRFSFSAMVFKIIGSLRNIRSGNFSPHGQHRVNLKNLRQGHAFRSGDVWLTRSRRYGDLKHALVPAQSIAEGGLLAVPLRRVQGLADRQQRLDMRLRELVRAARAGTIPGGPLELGVLHVEILEAAAPTGAADLVLDLHRQTPPTRI